MQKCFNKILKLIKYQREIPPLPHNYNYFLDPHCSGSSNILSNCNSLAIIICNSSLCVCT